MLRRSAAAPEPDGGNDDHSHEERGQHNSRQQLRGDATLKRNVSARARGVTGRAGGDPPWAISLALAVTLLIAFGLFSRQRRLAWWAIAAVLFVPVLMAVYVALRGRQANERVVAAAFVASLVSNQLPKSVTAMAAALVAAAFGLATRPASGAAAAVGTEHPRSGAEGGGTKGARDEGMALKTRAVLSCLFMIAVLMHENFMIWVVSATYEPSHSPPYPDPLQDNGRIVLTKFADAASLTRRDVQSLRDAFNIQWALVAAAVAGALVGCELKLGRAAHRNMWAVGMRALLTLGIARFVRTVSFLLTVLPSQIPSCYRNHYPYPVPDTWAEWIMVGMKPAARGGCNDLIISGHSTVTTVLACVGTSVADNTMFSAATWSLLAFDYLIEVYQGFHYSVDMWMGAVLTSLIFRSLTSVEPKSDEETKAEFLPLSSVTVRDVVVYTVPALLAFVIITVSEEAIANLWIILYTVAAAVAQIKGEQHFSRHIFICDLYIALIVYL